MSIENVSSVAGVVLSLIFAYIPGVAERYYHLDGTRKRLIMAAMLGVVAGGALALTCSGWGRVFGMALTCDQNGIALAVRAYISALIANQGTYMLLPMRHPLPPDSILPVVSSPGINISAGGAVNVGGSVAGRDIAGDDIAHG